MSVDITVDEWLAELSRLQQSDPGDGWYTCLDLVEKLSLPRNRVMKLLHCAAKANRLQTQRIPRINLAGMTHWYPAYRLTPTSPQSKTKKTPKTGRGR
jgi:hypothetical protein